MANYRRNEKIGETKKTYSTPAKIVLKDLFSNLSSYNQNLEIFDQIHEFTLLSARWSEIQKFVWKFKAMKRIHDMQFWVFFIFQNKRKALKGAAA